MGGKGVCQLICNTAICSKNHKCVPYLFINSDTYLVPEVYRESRVVGPKVQWLAKIVYLKRVQ